MFWHTAHYRDAATGRHSGTSHRMLTPTKVEGGGPSCEHVYTGGLTLYHRLTGCGDAAMPSGP